MPPESPQDLVERARALAISMHDQHGHTRSDGTPYWRHPERVVETLRKHAQPPEVLAAAWMHDLAEDCPGDLAGCEALLARLGKEFGPEVGSLAREVTNFHGPEATMEQKQARLCEHALQMSRGAKWIKLADRWDNISGMQNWSAEKRARYARATMNLMEALRPWPEGADVLAEGIVAKAREFLKPDR